MKKVTKLVLIALALVMMLLLTGCMTEAEKVSHNVSKEADNFNVTRRITVFNIRSDKVLLEIIGNLSVQNSGGDIDIIVETEPGHYKKHFVRLNSWTAYVVEDVTGAFVDKYHYEINFLPEMIVPLTFTQNR